MDNTSIEIGFIKWKPTKTKSKFIRSLKIEMIVKMLNRSTNEARSF